MSVRAIVDFNNKQRVSQFSTSTLMSATMSDYCLGQPLKDNKKIELSYHLHSEPAHRLTTH